MLDDLAISPSLKKESYICIEIKKTHQRDKYLTSNSVTNRGWLKNINFSTLPARLFSMYDQLSELFNNKMAKTRYCVWDFLVEELGGSIASMLRAQDLPPTKLPRTIYNNSLPG
jgi:hypothetical protein